MNLKYIILLVFLFDCAFSSMYLSNEQNYKPNRKQLVAITGNGQKFVATRQIYNGSLGYDGLFEACAKEYPESVPCNRINLMNYFWDQNTRVSWILQLDYNCVGYSTNVTYSMGPCLYSGKNGYIMQCSCDMKIPVCCTQN